MLLDKINYTRYQVFLEGIVAHEKGFNFRVELVDISLEGAKLKILNTFPLKEGDNLNLVIKDKNPLKIKGTIKWIRYIGNNMEIGLKFDSLDKATSHFFADFLFSLALSSLSDTYLK